MKSTTKDIIDDIVEKDGFKREKFNYDMLGPETRILVIKQNEEGKNIDELISTDSDSEGKLFNWVEGIKLIFGLAGFVNGCLSIYERIKKTKEVVKKSDFIKETIELNNNSAYNLSDSQIEVIVLTIMEHDKS